MAVSVLLLIAILVISFLWYRDQQRAELESRAALVSRLFAQYSAVHAVGTGREDEGAIKEELAAKACDEAPDFAVKAFEDIVGKDCEDVRFSVEITQNQDVLPDCEGDLCDFQVFADRLFVTTIE